MARNEETKSVPEGKTTNRQLAARVNPAPGVPDPRDLNDNKRAPGPSTSPGGLTASKSDGGEGVTSNPFIFVTFSGLDQPLSPPKNGHPRRCYDETERRQVAETRKRGACSRCRAAKIKCTHSSKVPTYSIQSHELFALGLTTSSLAVNRDEHKHVMEEKIAEINNTLVKAQENISEQDGEATGNGEVKAAASAVTQLPPEPSIPKSLPSQKPKQPPKVCHPQSRPPLPKPFKEGLNTFKVTDGHNDGQKRRRGNAALLKKDRLLDMTNGALGRKGPIARKTAESPQPIVCQQGPMASVMTETPATCTSVTANSALVLIKVNETFSSYPTSNQSGGHGCTTIQASVISPKSKTPAVAPAKPRLERRMTRRLSGSSSQESHATTPAESMLSFGRSQSPSSDRLPSEPRAYVCMSEVEHHSSETILYEKLLYDDNFPPPDDGFYSPLDVSECVNMRSLAKVMETSEDDAASSDGMDLDDDL